MSALYSSEDLRYQHQQTHFFNELRRRNTCDAPVNDDELRRTHDARDVKRHRRRARAYIAEVSKSLKKGC
jgi:hypothetical protein